MGLGGREAPGPSLSLAGGEGVTGNQPRVGGRAGPVGGCFPGNPGSSCGEHPENIPVRSCAHPCLPHPNLPLFWVPGCRPPAKHPAPRERSQGGGGSRAPGVRGAPRHCHSPRQSSGSARHGGKPGGQHQTGDHGRWGKHERQSRLGTVTPTPGDTLRGQPLPQHLQHACSSPCRRAGRDGPGLLRPLPWPLPPSSTHSWGQAETPGQGQPAAGCGSHCRFPIPYLCSKGRSSVLGNCSYNLQERD